VSEQRNAVLRRVITYTYITLVLGIFRVVRSVKWGDGSHVFATAADPFTSRDLGTISIFSFPSPEDLTEGTLRPRTDIMFS
jgi:hypothetical protein